jgi:peptidoglycan/LPS O-acetylase OafA/YrhL
MVFGFHVHGHFAGLIRDLLGYGWLGVEVFFAISGFVIARSVGRARITPGYVGNFILRRSIRLDPPYWCAIALACLVIVLSNWLITDRRLPLPAAAAVAAHAVYLQNILGHGDIVDIFWSLCIEVQFYLAFVVLTGAIQRASVDGLSFSGRAGRLAIAVFGALGLIGVLSVGWLKAAPKTWFLPFWNEFFVGALVAWILQGRISRYWFVAYGILLLGGSALLGFSISTLAAVGTATVILVAGETGRLHSGMVCGWLPRFGRMSYSFYLVHTLVLSRLTRLLERLGSSSEVTGGLVVVAGLAASIAVSGALYLLVEAPCVRLSKWFKRAPATA